MSDAPSRPRLSGRWRTLVPALLTIVGVPIIYWLVYGPPYLNYDAAYSLLWASDIAHGWTPDYNNFIAPTPHPLQTFVSFLALPLGSWTVPVLAWLVMFCFGGLCWIVYLIGKELFNDWVGVLAAIIIITRPAFAKNVLAAYQDIPFILFVCWALLLEIRKPRNGVPVLALLALAGLLRPEAWVLSGLYWLYLWPARTMKQRALLALIVGSAPVLWAISDWAVTGDFLHSFHGTSDLAAQLERPREPIKAPYWTLKFFAWTLREPLMIGVPIGLVYCWFCARRQGLLLFGMATLMSLIFIATTIGGLPLIARYVLTPTILLAVIYAAGVFGWRSLPKDFPNRMRWKWVGYFSLALSIVFIPWFIPVAQDQADKIHNYETIQSNLRDVADAPTVRTFNEYCGRISTTDHRPVPAFRYELEQPPSSVQSDGNPDTPLAALALYPASQDIVDRFYSEKDPDLTPPKDPAGRPYEVVYSSWAWKLYASPACVDAVKRGEKLKGAEKAGDPVYGPGGTPVPLN